MVPPSVMSDVVAPPFSPTKAMQSESARKMHHNVRHHGWGNHGLLRGVPPPAPHRPVLDLSTTPGGATVEPGR